MKIVSDTYTIIACLSFLKLIYKPFMHPANIEASFVGMHHQNNLFLLMATVGEVHPGLATHHQNDL
jgi:hypothetical protein